MLKLVRAMLVIALVVPMLAFGLFAWHSHNQTIQSAEDRAQRFAAVVQEHALKVFETIGLVLQVADQRLRGVSAEDLGNSKALWEELKRLAESSDQVGSIFVVDRDGLNRFTTRTFPSPPVHFYDRDYYHEQRNSDRGLYIGQAYVGKISDQQIFNFSIRRSSDGGVFDGVVGVSAFVNSFTDFYSSLGRTEDDFAVGLIRSDGSVLIRYPSIQPDNSRVAWDHPFLEKLRLGDRGTFFARSPFTGRDRLYGYVKVRGFPVFAIYGIDQQAITNEWLKTIYQAAALTFVIACCLFATAWFALRRVKQEALATESLRHTTQRLEQEIIKRKRAEASLMQAQRLEAVGQLTGGIAHDFNNLLTIIIGNVDLASRRSDLNSVRRMLASIRYATERAAALTGQLLTFSRREMLNPKTVSLKFVLERTRTLIGHLLPDNIRLEVAPMEDLCPVRLDVSEFEAAVLNLIANARDAMPAGGTISLNISDALVGEEQVDTASPNLRAGRYVELRVKDTGCGMTPETVARIFEPFFTTKEVGKGTGLGLSQVYGFVQQCGGSIFVESAVGQGTRVSVFFPRSQEPIAAEPDALQRVQKLNRPITILVVEDDAEVRNTSTAMLHDLGHSILLARNGAEALALLGAGDPIDVLFTDVLMPGGMDGVELAKQAVAARPELKVLITTGYPGRSSLLHSGFVVLPKPFTRVDLDRLIQALVEQRENEQSHLTAAEQLRVT